MTAVCSKNMDKGLETDIKYLDFQKIFDYVSHHGLLKTLEIYRIKGEIYK